MYISGGENVYPAEVENVLFQLPQVADAAIIGVPNERWGEVGMAIIVRKPDQPLEEGDVIRHCLGRLAKFKVPQSVAFVDMLPRNATGKVLKRELRTQFVGHGRRPRSPSLRQRYVVVLAHALQDQEGERTLAGVGHQMRAPGHRSVGLAGFQPDLLLRVLQEQAHLAFQHVEGVGDVGVEVPGYGLAGRELQLADVEARALGMAGATLDLVEVARILDRLKSWLAVMRKG